MHVYFILEVKRYTTSGGSRVKILKRSTLVLLLVTGVLLFVLSALIGFEAIVTDNQWIGTVSLACFIAGYCIWSSPLHALRQRLAN